MKVLTSQCINQAYISLRFSLFIVLLVFQSGCAHSPANKTGVYDPFEPSNRSAQRFNDAADSLGPKPAAKGYTSIIPEPVRKGVGNFFSNLEDPAIAANQLLQGKVKLSIEDSARFIFNSTFGLAGLVDISTPMGLEKHEEDFGQTFAVWGVGSGPHFTVPFVGPTNIRDGAGDIVGAIASPVSFLSDVSTRNALTGLSLIDKRASLLSAESLISGDRYLFIRDIYNQRRDFLINDGVVEDAFLEGE